MFTNLHPILFLVAATNARMKENALGKHIVEKRFLKNESEARTLIWRTQYLNLTCGYADQSAGLKTYDHMFYPSVSRID